MDILFEELQTAIQEGSDLDLKNEDCHKLNDYIDSQLQEIKDQKSTIETLGDVIELNRKTLNNYAKADTMNRELIERLKGDREKLSELSRFDLVSGDIQSEFDGDYVLLSDVKEKFEPPKEPELSITIDPEVFGKTVVVGGYRKP